MGKENMRPNPVYNTGLNRVARAAHTRIKHCASSDYIELAVGNLRVVLHSEIDARYAHVQRWTVENGNIAKLAKSKVRRC